MAQRLVRTLCDCRQVASDGTATPSGCAACRYTGFRGRTAVHEFMRMTPPLRKLLLQDSLSTDDLRRASHASGMRAMYEDGLRKAARGRTTLHELLHVVSPPEDDDVRPGI
jgi:type II secretory ATPase GspE/PulE/Tfp pilus assembly ATPase PilB-like protein